MSLSSSAPRAGPLQSIDFSLAVVAAGLIFMLLSGLFWFLRSFGLPLEAQLAALTRFAVNPLLEILPEAWAAKTAWALRDTARQAAFGAWLVAAVAAPLTLGYLGRGARRFKKVLTLESLLAFHAERVPRVRVILNCDPRKDKDPKGPWAPTMRRWDWAKEHNIPVGQTFDLDNPPKPLRDALVDQLNLVNPAGVERAQRCVQAVMLVCLERIVHGRKAGNDLIDELATSFEGHKLRHYRKLQKTGLLPNDEIISTRWTERIAEEPVKAVLREARERHHFASTQVVWLIKQARKHSGVMEPSALLWIKPTCRPLWLAIHQVGLEVAWAEACATASHYKFEEEEGHAVKEPYLRSAIFGLNEVLAPKQTA